MSFDLIAGSAVLGTSSTPRSERTAEAATAAHPSSRFGPVPVRPAPFADLRTARWLGHRCRTLLGRHLDGAALDDAVAVVVAAKVMDEAVPGPPRFLAVAGAPRVSSQRFDHLVDDAARRLAAEVGCPLVAIDVPELVGHQLLHDLGPHSVLATADRHEGAAWCAGFVAELLGGAPPSPVWSGLPAVVPARADARRRHAVELVCRAAGAAPGGRRPIGHG